MCNKFTMEMSICQADNGFSLDKNRKAIFFKLKAVPNTPKAVSKGTRLRRDWKGKTYEVFVRDDGKFEYDGAVYRSLSAVATEITGTHWNGKKFF